jgi:hypothetical protein
MSLPAATKDVGDHPAKGSVIDPINREAKEADVDRKVPHPTSPISSPILTDLLRSCAFTV